MLKPLIFLSFLLSGCGERPPFPSWPKPTQTGPEQVVLSDRLTVTDLRAIARAVNGSGKLQSLQPWIEGISDEQLQLLGKLLYDFFYQDALSSGSLVDLLEKRIDQDAFNTLYVLLEHFSDPASSPEVGELVKTLLGHPKFPVIVDLNVHWVDPMWAGFAQARKHRAQAAPADLSDVADGLPENGVDLFAQPQSTLGWVAELHTALHGPVDLSNPAAQSGRQAIDAAVKNLSEPLSRSHFVSSTLQFLKQLQSESKATNGLFADLKEMASKPYDGDPSQSQLSAFVAALNTLVGSSHEVFDEINEVLRKPGISREIGNLLQPQKRDSDGLLSTVISYKPVVPLIVAGSIRRNVERSKSVNTIAAWKTVSSSDQTAQALNTTIRVGIEGIVGSALPVDKRGAAQFNLPIFINTLALTEWFKHAVHASGENLKKLKDDKALSQLWDLKVEVPSLSVPITDEKGRILPAVRTRLALTLGGQATQELKALENALLSMEAGEWKYEFPESGKTTLSEAFKKAVQHCDEVFAFADISSVVRGALFYATEPQASVGQSPIQQLDSDSNLLLKLNGVLAALPEDAIELVTPLLTQPGTSVADSIQDFRSLFERERPGPVTEEKTRVLDALQTVATIAATLAAGKDTSKTTTSAGKLFSLYVRWLKALGSEERKAVGALIQLVHATGILESNLTGTQASFRYPALIERVLGSAGQPSLLTDLAVWDTRELFELERGIGNTLTHADGTEATSVYLEWIRTLKPRKTQSWDGLVTLFTKSSGGMTTEERLWIQHFVREKGVHRVWGFFGNNGSWNQSAGLIQELIRLTEQGSLDGPLDLFEQIRDDRIKRIARVFKKWYHTGQFLAFLRACEKLIQQSPGAA